MFTQSLRNQPQQFVKADERCCGTLRDGEILNMMIISNIFSCAFLRHALKKVDANREFEEKSKLGELVLLT